GAPSPGSARPIRPARDHPRTRSCPRASGTRPTTPTGTGSTSTPGPPTSNPSPAGLQHAELAADRLGELVVARLLRGHRVRRAHAVVVRVQLRPEHRQPEQRQGADREADAAEHYAADRPAGPGRAT